MSSIPSLESVTRPSGGGKNTGWVLALVLFATLGLYLRALGGEFVYDDKLLIERNPSITSLTDPIGLLFSPYWDFQDPGNALQIGYWRPLTALSNALAWALGDGSPWAFHAFGIAVHLAATAVAFRMVLRLANSLFVAGSAALVFGLHPTHVESVAWISALNDPLFGLFGLLAVERFLAWRQGPQRGLAWGAALAFALALASKELGAAVLPLCLVLDLARRERGPWVRAYLPFAVVLMGYLLARMAVFDSPWAGFDRQTTHFGVDAMRLALLHVELLGGSLELLAWPSDLKLFRAFRPDLTLTSPQILRAWAWIAAASAAGWFLWRRRSSTGLFALLLIPAALSPALIKVSSLGSFPIADRFLYVPVLGAGILLALALQALMPTRIAAALVLVVGGLLAWKSAERIATWHDQTILYETAARETPRSPYVLWGLGRVHLENFTETEDVSELNAAFASFEASQELLVEVKRGAKDLFVSERDFLQTNLGLGSAWIYRAQVDPNESFSTAVAILEVLADEVERIENEAAAARRQGYRVVGGGLELHQVYVALGRAYALAGREEEGEDRLQRALRLVPSYPPANLALANLYFERGELKRAQRFLEQVLAVVPHNAGARVALARCLVQDNQLDRAEEIARDLKRKGQGRAEPDVLLATIALRRNRLSEALAHLDQALEIDPQHGYAWFHRGNAFYLLGKQPQALQAFRRAADLLPRDFEVNFNFGNFLLESGALDAARPYLVTAYDIGTEPALQLKLRQLLAALPDPSVAFYLALSRSDRKHGALDQAEAWLDAATHIAPQDPEVLREKARLLDNRGRPEEALEWLRRLTELQPDAFETWSEYGAALARLEQKKEAAVAFRRALACDAPTAWPEELFRSSRAALERRLSELEK